LDVKKFKKYLNLSSEIQGNKEYDMLIEYAISDLTKLYIIKYIKHQTIKYNEYLFELLKQFHKWHKADKSHNRISEDYIRKIFYNLSGDERIQLFKQLNYI
jgi:predicted transcriptional regulator